jgi:hypothetical protein
LILKKLVKRNNLKVECSKDIELGIYSGLKPNKMLKILILPLFLVFHPVHVTVTTIDQAQGTDSMRIFFRMYYDDFLRDYKSFDPDFSFEKISGDKSVPDNMIIKYFNDRVKIYVNHKLLTGKLLSASNDTYEIYLNLLYKSDKNPKKFKIKNQVLTGLYSDQTNMIFINISKNEEAMRLTPEHNKETRSF